ncbi:MAG TPA: MlaE family lipid ABC transporter permease subunit [Stellaceae bacterium]|jgi:phospholipid/cholesterol/gamma-HCH transport system permease protein|nr:MlaE family lipid ABC transporter permease subunit [Stellaceae bacterium]
MASAAATFVASEEAGSVVLEAAGEWLVGAAGELDRRLRGFALPSGRQVTLDLAGIDRLDTTGAWLLLRTEHDLTQRGNAVELRNLREDFIPLLDQVRASGRLAPTIHQRPAHHTLAGFLARIGRFTIGMFTRTYSVLGFFGLVCATAAELVTHPRRIRAVATISQIEQTGVNALGIVGLLSFLIGVVIAYQGADQLRRFGAEIYTVDLLGVSILRELGVLMTAIIIAGRSGSAFTAEIGTMRVNEEIDAMRTIGLDPIEVLVMPRLSGLLVTLPLLTLYANLMALLGGCLMCQAVLGITIPQFIRELQYALYPRTFWIGVIKAPFFAVIIALIGCYEGFQVSRSAQSVGRMTTLSVVESIFLVIVTDAVFSVLFSILGI